MKASFRATIVVLTVSAGGPPRNKTLPVDPVATVEECDDNSIVLPIPGMTREINEETERECLPF